MTFRIFSMNNKHLKSLTLFLFLIASITGFLVKLPKVFHHYDKVLHASFYLLSFLFVAVLYPRRWWIIGISLALFGWIIEYAQHYSNKIFIRAGMKRIHGNFDPEDIRFNLIGLAVGLVIFIILSPLWQWAEKKISPINSKT